MPSLEDIIAIPHVVKVIAQHSTRQTLARCVRVNKAFHEAFIPHLWYYIERTSYDTSPFFKITPDTIAKYGRHIRSASLCEMVDFILLADCSPNLISLTSPSIQKDWARLSTLFSAHLPHIEHLDLCLSSDDPSDFLSFLSPLKNLRSLTIQYYEARFPTELMAAILTRCRRQAIRLERFEIVGKVHATMSHHQQHGQGQQQQQDNAGVIVANSSSNDVANAEGERIDDALSANGIEVPLTLTSFLFKDLHYDPSFSNYPTKLVLIILRQCPHLKEISLPQLDSLQLGQICGWLRSRRHERSALTAIHFGPYTPLPDAAQSDMGLANLILSLNPNTLKQLTFRAGYVGPKVIDAVLSHHPLSIQVLDTRGSPDTYMTSTLARAFLTQCPSLIVFNIERRVSSAILSGMDAINDGRPWRCKDLQELQLSIGGFCLQSNNGDEEGTDGKSVVPCQTHHKCLSQERQVMQQLGRLHHLQSLDTSIWPPEQPPGEMGEGGGMLDQVAAPPHLAWTLEAGLDELAPLKWLKLFFNFGVQHKANMAEIKWMKQHWPLMQELSLGWGQGLFESDIAEWLKLHWPKVYETMNLLRWFQ